MTDTAQSPKSAAKPKRHNPAARARAGVDRMRDQATSAVEAGAEAIDSAPLSALAGAIALGAVAAALIPNSRRELQIAGPVGGRVRGALEEAFAAAKTAGAEQLTAKGLTSTALTNGIGQLVGNILTAAMAASTAASDSVRQGKTATLKAPPRKRA
ncbi:MAG: hypothetical protein H0X36_00650 [Sphingomonadaceae bacterium]|nr:hypothetical protein [Sphingomonadaceae bacterium]